MQGARFTLARPELNNCASSHESDYAGLCSSQAAGDASANADSPSSGRIAVQESEGASDLLPTNSIASHIEDCGNGCKADDAKQPGDAASESWQGILNKSISESSAKISTAATHVLGMLIGKPDAAPPALPHASIATVNQEVSQQSQTCMTTPANLILSGSNFPCDL